MIRTTFYKGISMVSSLKKLSIGIAILSLFIAIDSHAEPIQSLEDWCLYQMSVWSPPGKSMFADAKESQSDAKARYRGIIKDAISIVYNPSEAPLFNGPYGRAKTLATLLAVADSESGFRKDVDFGEGKASKGDSGRSWCLMQIQLGAAVGGKTPMRIALKGDVFEYVHDPSKGWGGEDLVKNRKACFQAALHVMRLSFYSCGSIPTEEKLTLYASGNCFDGRKASRVRMNKAMQWLSVSPPPATDSDVMKSMTPTPVISN